jgi:hypothetical protein
MSEQAQIVRIFEAPSGRVRLETPDRSYLGFRPVWAVPYTMPGRYLALLDLRDKEIVTIPNPESLPGDVREPLLRLLRERHLSPTVSKILSVRNEFGVTYWHTVTDRGPKDFVTQSLQENAHWIAPGHLVVTDVDGNRFEIRVGSLDTASRRLLAQTV